jgi:phosphoheptose isomerase
MFLDTKISIEVTFAKILQQLNETRKNNHSLFLVGNGGSARVASHALVDFVNLLLIWPSRCTMFPC